MTTKLEQTLAEAGFPHISSVLSIRLLDAATIDNHKAYARGVEDANTLAILEEVDLVFLARNTWGKLCRANNQPDRARHLREIFRLMDRATAQFDKAFRGARNLARVEIRQRLEEMKNG